jgi:hypothetical protein
MVDLDGDGLLDLALTWEPHASYQSGSYQRFHVKYYRNTGTLQQPAFTEVLGGARSGPESPRPRGCGGR